MAFSSQDTNTYNHQSWEESEFPILCQTCLGPNPYVRMTKEKFGKECKVCSRPFTIFRWCPGSGMRFKKTEICQTCAKLKNVCQTCLLDLEYGLPTQVRDAAMGLKDTMPQSEVNKEFYTQRKEQELAATDGLSAPGQLGKATAGHESLLRMARTTPYYKRNRAHICSFWVKGECKRGEECPFRHEMPTDPSDPLAKQNLKDRYFGVNDPVAEKIMRRSKSTSALEPPADKTIMSLYIGGVEEPVITDQHLRDYFYQFGEIRTVNLVPKQKAAFVHFTTRQAAERAALQSFDRLVLNGRKLKVLWGRAPAARSEDGGAPRAFSAVPGLPGLPPPPPPPGAEDGAAAAAGGDEDSVAAASPAAPAAPRVSGGASALPPPPPMRPGVGGPIGMPIAGLVQGPGGFFLSPAGAGALAAPPGVHYPSMDPHRLGTRAPRPADPAAPRP